MTGISARDHFGVMPMPRKEMPSGRATSSSWARCAMSSVEVSCTVSTAAPDSSNWPPGSSVIAPPPGDVEQADDVAGFDDRFPAEQHLHALEQRADAALAVIRNRRMSIAREGEFLVLGSEPKARLRPDALLEPAHEIVARLDGRHVDLIASHAGGSGAKGPRPYTRVAESGSQPQGRQITKDGRSSAVLRPQPVGRLRPPRVCSRARSGDKNSRPCRPFRRAAS